MGGGEHGIRGRPSSACAKCGWWQGVPVVVKGAVFPSSATANAAASPT
jgi:hypothetical protein